MIRATLPSDKHSSATDARPFDRCSFADRSQTPDAFTADPCATPGKFGCPLVARVDERVRFETLLADLSATFVNLATEEVDSQIESALGRLVQPRGDGDAAEAEAPLGLARVALTEVRGHLGQEQAALMALKASGRRTDQRLEGLGGGVHEGCPLAWGEGILRRLTLLGRAARGSLG